MPAFNDDFVMLPDPAAKDGYDEFLDSLGHSKTFSENGVHYCLYYNFGRPDLQRLRETLRLRDNCNACTHRASSLAGYAGPSGPLFLDNVKSKTDGCPIGTFYRLREQLVALHKGNFPVTAVIVKEGMFPKIHEGISAEGVPYRHPTIDPDSCTDPELAAKYEPILAHYQEIISHRLEKLCVPEAIASVKIMADNVQSLKRPDHWQSVLQWVTDVQNHFTGIGKPFVALSPESRVHLAVYALTTGRTDGTVHFDYQQSSNIVDFLTYSSVDALCTEMDQRSDPDNYMVSQLARAMAKHQISSKHTISLVWEGKFTDDLDIHVRFGGKEVYYGKKAEKYGSYTVKLDFDANVSKGEKEPAENVSCCPGTFQVLVNNYTKRTRGDVPFTVIIHQEGLPDKVIEQVWPTPRRSGNKMIICEHTFTEVDDMPAAMSEKDAARAKALNAKWEKHFGAPVSNVPCLSELDPEKFVTCATARTPGMQPTGDANQAFMAMATATADKPRKKYLSEHVARQLPRTLADLVDYCRNGSHSVKIDPRSFAPGYVTKITTTEEVTKKPYSFNHYEQKFKLPTCQGMQMGNARFNENWFLSGQLFRSVAVRAFVQFGSFYFIVIDGTCLPVNDSDFPLGGGFNPTDLKSDVHDLRDRWAFCNTQVKPTVTKGTAPLIGSFVVSDSIPVVLDGKPINVRVASHAAS